MNAMHVSGLSIVSRTKEVQVQKGDISQIVTNQQKLRNEIKVLVILAVVVFEMMLDFEQRECLQILGE